MKRWISKILVSISIIASVMFPAMAPVTVHAVDPFGACSGNTQSKVCQARTNDSVFKILKSVINILLYIVGIVSVILIIVGGLKYITSAGDSNGVNSAKNTILYSVVGLVIAVLAYAIVNFVLGYF